MSFRLFVYYCALCGGWAAFLGWLLGAVLVQRQEQNLVLQMGLVGMFLGLTTAFGLGLIDALWVLPWQRFGQILLRVLFAVLVGALGGFLGGMLGQFLYGATGRFELLAVAWLVVGTLCGMAVGSFEFLAATLSKQDRQGARSKFFKCMLGGTAGGVFGAILFELLRRGLLGLFNKNESFLLSPRALGFVAVGVSTGLLVGLAQVILKEAWIRVEAGFRAGREMILIKQKTSVGRAEGSDIALFGDSAIEKLHANIVQDHGRYYLEDNATPGGTYVNDQRINGRAALQSGDMIRMGKSVLRFYERQKRRV